MKERVIIHSDINHCYAQIEEMKHPELRHVPMAVGGHEETRHGIILAKNDLAKAAGVKTAETLRDALKKCPELLIIHPYYDDYLYYTEKVKDIYREYTDQVESFGLDEAWIDLTASTRLFGDPVLLAKHIQQRIYDELGLSVSMGVSYNKVFAKIASDLHKQRGFTVITKENYQETIWPLPIEDLFYVGYRTAPKLRARGIGTIGDLAKLPCYYMRGILGKFGETLWYFANGYDETEVALTSDALPVKSVGNGITAVHDLHDLQDVKMVYYVLVESVATRLKAQGLKGRTVSIAMRDHELHSFSRQKTILQATNTVEEIMAVVMELVTRFCDFSKPYRSINITVSSLTIDDGREQLSFLVDEEERHKQKILDQVMDEIRAKYGFDKVRRLVTLLDDQLTHFDPLQDHVIHPVGYFHSAS